MDLIWVKYHSLNIAPVQFELVVEDPFPPEPVVAKVFHFATLAEQHLPTAEYLRALFLPYPLGASVASG